GEEVRRPLPDAGQAGQGVARVVELQVDPLVAVADEDLPAVLEVPVLHVDERLALGGEPGQQAILDLLGLPAVDLPVAGALVEAERVELLIDAELHGEELVDEGDVVVELPDLEDLAAAEPEAAIPVLLGRHVLAVVPLLAEAALVPAVLDVAEELDA